MKASRIVVADRGSVRLERDEADDPVVESGFRTRAIHDLDRLVGLGIDDVEEETAPGGALETHDDRDFGITMERLAHGIGIGRDGMPRRNLSMSVASTLLVALKT